MLVKAVMEPNGVLACSRLLFVLLVVEPENAAHCVELSCCLAAAGGVVVVAIPCRHASSRARPPASGTAAITEAWRDHANERPGTQT